MEKSLAHWRAEHPLLFISSSLCIGYLIANYFNHIQINAPIITAFFILIISLGLLIIIHQLHFKKGIQGILIILVLISWGVTVFLVTPTQNLLWVPYPTTLIIKARALMIYKIDSSIMDIEASGFAKALLIGVKTDIDKNLLNAYTQLGIIHIIAISGMHLDIIFKNLVHLTHYLPRKRFWIWLELVLILIGVWAYTLIAFASPSVVRASLFFSLYFMGTFLNQAKYTLNCIAGGLLVIIFFDIHSIHQIGLQLSYAAVIGIHLFFPLLYKMLPMDNPALNWMWRNLCVTLAAQLTTLPILLFHFHQISTLVIISNFIMVPLSTLLLYALILLVFIPYPFKIDTYLGHWTQAYIQLLNKGVLYFHRDPMATPLWIQMSEWMVVVYYLWLFFLYQWLYNKKAKYLFYSWVIFTLYYLIKLFP